MMKTTLLGVLGLFSFSAFGGMPAQVNGGSLPPCLSSGRALPIDNQQVIEWKKTTQNQYKARARVQGPIVKLYADRTGHAHFGIDLGSQETLEIIYNENFGVLPDLEVGMQVEACGDYITSVAQSGPYPPSPDGAILHWVHKNPKPGGHPSGYVTLEGRLYGWSYGNNQNKFQLESLFPSFESAFIPALQ